MPDPIMPALELTAELSFILDLGVAILAALVAGAVAARLGQPPLVGYLVAGVAIGPFTPGFVGDVEHISTLAELGIVLLLFAIGVEFSLGELRRVRRVVIPGAVAQILVVTLVGALASVGLGFEIRAALVIGAALAISSTLVVFKLLSARGAVDSLHGRTAVAWMILQDLATIVFIAGLPPLAGGDPIGPIALSLVRAAVFLAVTFLVGTRLLPVVFRAVARLGSPELFLLAVFATALLAAFVSSAVFGLSLALGAFVAGLVVSESELSHQAAGEILPFRDLFAVLFFVSVGMLLDPARLAADAPALVVLLAVAVAGKALVSAAAGWALGLPLRSALILGASIAQVGEFSFLLAEGGLDVGILDARGYNLVLGTAVLSIVVSPYVLRGGEWLATTIEMRAGRQLPTPDGATPGTGGLVRGEPGGDPGGEPGAQPGSEPPRLGIVVLGVGRVGRLVVRAARIRGFRVIAVDRDERRLEDARRLGAATLFGDAANPEILRRCELERAQVVVVAIGDRLTARLATERALALNPRLTVATRARGRREIDALRAAGARRVADPEAEAAFALARAALQRMGVSGAELDGIVLGLRREAYGADASR
ncbi:MAG TPA: cation:proton antiporter family protein [Candidatus Limnocylindrales bacterium]|nr:cation:proton antiporter family protein [Candidatus Limnocylindrales bacterium]